MQQLESRNPADLSDLVSGVAAPARCRVVAHQLTRRQALDRGRPGQLPKAQLDVAGLLDDAGRRL